jgi:hypothetical protein
MSRGPYRIINSSVLPNLQEILLYDEQYNHIIKSHPEFLLPTLYGSIDLAVSVSTTSVHSSRTNAKSVVFVDSDTTNYSGDPLRVPVKSIGSNTGIITSAYFASSKSHGIEIWRKK